MISAPGSGNSTSRTVDKDHEPRYELIWRAGVGAYAQVFKAFDNVNQTYVAIKQIDLEQSGESLDDTVIDEINIMQNFFCDQLVKYHTSCFAGCKFWIVMEYCEGGSLSEVVKFNNNSLDENIISYILRELLLALAYLHSNMKIHRDIKVTKHF